MAQQTLHAFTLATDTQAPKILLDPPAPNAVVAGNVNVAGHVLDHLSGVATLQLKVDNGNFTDVAFDANGAFAVPTTFALDGSADGPHRVTLQATDQQGNASTPLVVAFTGICVRHAKTFLNNLLK